MLRGTSQAIGKRLSGRFNDTSVAPEFKPKHNCEQVDIRAWRADDVKPPEIGDE